MILIDLLLIDKGDDPVFGLIAPYIPFTIAAARSGNPAASGEALPAVTL